MISSLTFERSVLYMYVYCIYTYIYIHTTILIRVVVELYMYNDIHIYNCTVLYVYVIPTAKHPRTLYDTRLNKVTLIYPFLIRITAMSTY